MRALMLEVDEALLERRRQWGADVWDEMWEGVLHMVPPPAGRHQDIGGQLLAALLPLARSRGLRLTYETGLYRTDHDYRVPDLMAYERAAASRRGVDGAPVLVVEIRSPGDESDAKVPWYIEQGAREVLVVDRDTLALELYGPDGPVPPEPGGSATLATLGARIRPTGQGLAVDGPSGTAEVNDLD
ncbi:MAG: Uma2 family endonuclease [Acidimicrobiales bacterium]